MNFGAPAKSNAMLVVVPGFAMHTISNQWKRCLRYWCQLWESGTGSDANRERRLLPVDQRALAESHDWIGKPDSCAV